MDLSPILNDGVQIAAILVVPLAGILAGCIIQIANARLGLHLTDQENAAVEHAVAVGAGMIRAKLAAGVIAPIDITTGNVHVDAAANAAITIVDASIRASGVTKQSVADQIVGAVGHALGNDPTVPSVPAAGPVPSTPTGGSPT